MITTSGPIIRMAKLAMLRGRLKSTLQAPEGAAVDVIVSHSLAARILETGIVADDSPLRSTGYRRIGIGRKLVNAQMRQFAAFQIKHVVMIIAQWRFIKSVI